MRVHREPNLKGEVCPATLVRTILALEEMEPGEVLHVALDYPLAARDVPVSVTNRGHAVLKVRQTGAADWSLTVRKGRAR